MPVSFQTRQQQFVLRRHDAKQLTVSRIGTYVAFGFMGFEPYLWAWDGDVLNADNTRAVLHGPEGIAAAQFLVDLMHTDHSSALATEIEGMASEVQLLTGRVGAILAGS